MISKDCSQINWEQVDVSWFKSNSAWILPQITAMIASLPLARSSGLISPTLSVAAIKGTIPTLCWPNGRPVLGFTQLWRFLLTNPRGNILSGTQTGGCSRWNSGVPLILGSWKEHRGVLYSAWDWTDPQIVHFVDEDILELVACQDVVVDDDLLTLRETACVVKTGAKAGSVRSLSSTIPFGSLGSSNFKSLSRLAKYCHTQTWIYHPTVRNPLQVYLPELDVAPPPLVVDDVIPQKGLKKSNTTYVSPFDDL